MLKRLKNIENKTDNQLDLIRDQGDRQLDSICYFNVGRKSIGFENQRLSKLKKETDDKENDIILNTCPKGEYSNLALCTGSGLHPRSSPVKYAT